MVNRRFLITLILIGTLLAAAGTALWHRISQPEPAPDVALQLIDGKTLRLNEWRGQVVLVNFWATSCSTCVQEMPFLVQLHQEFKNKGFNTVAVAMAYDPPNYVLNFAQTRALPFAVALDTQGTAAKAFGDVALTPTSFLINRQGQIVRRYLGIPPADEIQALLRQLLAQGAAS